jgi:hypothetical protein
MLAKITSAALAVKVAAALAAAAVLVPLALTSPLADDAQPVACQGPYCGG